jgi:ABC-type antimicrobial peptide transport system permease subunit
VLRDAIGQGRDEITLVAPTRYIDAVDTRFAIHRFGARIAGVAGLFALGLALLGLYGAVSFSVTQRFREMAIRQAMGAGRKRVLRSLVGGTVRTAALGMAAGLATALALARLARSEMFGVSPLDPMTVGGAVAAIGLATILASLAPARRLLQATPMDVLRDE